MSFSKNIKTELSDKLCNARHCRIAELAGLVELLARGKEDGKGLVFSCENKATTDKFVVLVKKLFLESLQPVYGKQNNMGKKKLYTVEIPEGELLGRLLDTLKSDREEFIENKTITASGLITQQLCCRRAYLRGAFLAAGSLSDPEKTYHFEIVARDAAQAVKLEAIMNAFELDAKTIIRKEKYIVVYIKDGSKISEALSVMEAYVSMMELENVRILKEMRNNVNRQVNCEAANLNKTVVASSKQIEDIHYIDQTIGLEKLKKELEEIARLRIEYPDSSLSELANMVSPPIGRSGVNHRLKKISQIAASLRET